MILDLRTTAEAVLAQVRTFLDKDAVIAGGFARDLLTDRIPKDVDIWYYQGAERRGKLLNAGELSLAFPASEDDVRTALAQAGHKVEKFRHCSEYVRSFNWCGYLTKMEVDGYHFDLIAVDFPVGQDAKALLETFDFGICRAAYDGEKFITHPTFDKDVREQTLTYVDGARPEEDMKRVLEDHLPRLKSKYPFHEVVGIEEFA